MTALLKQVLVHDSIQFELPFWLGTKLVFFRFILLCKQMLCGFWNVKACFFCDFSVQEGELARYWVDWLPIRSELEFSVTRVELGEKFWDRAAIIPARRNFKGFVQVRVSDIPVGNR
jgi:hypothetical protein